MLIEARTVMKLYEILNTFIYKNACVVQSFARSTSATLKLNRRVAIWKLAIGASMSMITSASEAYRTELDNRQVYHVEILDVQENEQTDRANIQDQCWVEWIAIQTDMQTTLEKNAKSALAGYLTQQHDEFKAVMSVRQIAALDDLANRVQERIMLQGAHLDGIVVQKVKQLESAKKRISTMRDAHNRRMQMLTINEEQKLETRQMIDKKGKAADRVALEREKKSAKLREEQWMRHERDRVTRIEMERTREAVAEQMRERFIMEGIEYTVAKRLAIEVTDRNRRIREEEELMMKREREERENEFKENEKKAVLEALKAKKGRHDEISLQSALKKKEVYRQWTAQERERKAVERLQKIEAIQNKKMTSSLLASHSLLESPMIFDQSGNRHISVRSKADRSYSNASTGFSMSNGRTVYSRIVPKDSLDAVIKFFGSKGNSNSTISDSHHRAKNP